MSDRWTARIARRPLLAGVLGIFGVGVAGGLVYEGVHVSGRHYPRTKYDDLLDQLPDRESAAKLGQTAIAQIESHTDVHHSAVEPKAIATGLRTGPGQGSIPRAVTADIDHGRLVAVQGWVLPVSLVEVAIVAARMSGTNG